MKDNLIFIPKQHCIITTFLLKKKQNKKNVTDGENQKQTKVTSC